MNWFPLHAPELSNVWTDEDYKWAAWIIKDLRSGNLRSNAYLHAGTIAYLLEKAIKSRKPLGLGEEPPRLGEEPLGSFEGRYQELRPTLREQIEGLHGKSPFTGTGAHAYDVAITNVLALLSRVEESAPPAEPRVTSNEVVIPLEGSDYATIADILAERAVAAARASEAYDRAARAPIPASLLNEPCSAAPPRNVAVEEL